MSLTVICCAIAVCANGDATPIEGQALTDGWSMQSGCVANDSGEQISAITYQPQGWIKAVVPGTVLGSQVEAGVFPHPFYGMNLRSIPGTDYPIGKIFGYLPMSESSPYRCSWWYRTEFSARAAPGRSTWLHFDGINYRASIWVNGKQVASSDQVAGAFRSYDFDVSSSLASEHRNVLAVEVFTPTEKDLGIDFLDWNPAPADKSMGLWRGVSIAETGPMTVANPAVITHFVDDALSAAELMAVVDVVNHASHAVSATISASVGPTHVEQTVELAANEARVVRFDTDHFPELRWKNPPIWWPYQYGKPLLERLHVMAKVDGAVSDEKAVRFGVREIDSSLNQDGYRQFRVNRRNLLIRGGGWAPDLFYREPAKRLRDELTYAKSMRLNTIRLEGKLGSDAMFDLADQMGILILAGWQCCDYWQQWEKWTPTDHAIAVASTYSQISRLRSHASLLAWLNGSDEAPSPKAEEESLGVIKEREWPNPVLSAAADRTSKLTGKTGVKMSGPYDYVPPEYWYLDKDSVGGAFGFNMETSPGPAIPTVASLRRTLPKESWWIPGEPHQDSQWSYHAGLGKFAQYNSFNSAMTQTYGAARSLKDYSMKSQLMAYDGERAMFEAYGANKYHATGVIQWMLNNAWPSFIWHLYDYYLVPGGGYFGTRKANEPLHIQYRFDTRGVTVVNSTLIAYTGLMAKASVYDLQSKQIFTHSSKLNVTADGLAEVFSIPAKTATTFLKLQLRDSTGSVVSTNFYWIPARLAELDWSKSTYVNTPAISYADMHDLSGLPTTSVRVKVVAGNQVGHASVRLTNEGTRIGFFLELRAAHRGTDRDVAPVFWSDNFVSLLPGETTVLSVSGLPANGADFTLSGWNIPERITTLNVAPK
jgi:exo-1,4-beta-D-glucosaminidase